jgi:PTS system galactitol-specific IIC component
MESFLEGIGNFLNSIGPLILLPIVIAVVGLILGQKFSSAIRSGLMTAVAFVGIFLTVGLLGETVSKIGEAFATGTGTNLDVIDIGWPAASALAFATPVGNLIIPLGIALNIILLLIGLTQTLDVDIWNFWHMAFVGALVQFVTGSFALGLFAAALTLVIALFLADWSAPLIQKHFKLPGISIPHLQSAGYMLLAAPFAWLFILALLARQSAVDVLLTAVNTAAVMLLIPRMVQILVEALTPVAQAARKFMRRFAGREFYIGMDSAILAGNSSVIAAGLLMVPVEILLALALSPLGNRTLPFIDLADGVFVAAMLAPLVMGDVILTTLLGAIVMGVGLIFTTLLAPGVTQMVNTSSLDLQIPTGYATYTVMSDAAVPTSYVLYFLFQTPAGIAILVSLALTVGLYYLKKYVPLEGVLGMMSEPAPAKTARKTVRKRTVSKRSRR